MRACTKTRNGETKQAKQAKRNETKPPKQSETTEMSTQNTVKYEKTLAIYGAKTVARVFPPLEW